MGRDNENDRRLWEGCVSKMTMPDPRPFERLDVHNAQVDQLEIPVNSATCSG